MAFRNASMSHSFFEKLRERIISRVLPQVSVYPVEEVCSRGSVRTASIITAFSIRNFPSRIPLTVLPLFLLYRDIVESNVALGMPMRVYFRCENTVYPVEHSRAYLES